MTRRSKLWRWAAVVYAFINAAGLAYAASLGEGMHAMVHLFLLLLGVAGYMGWRLARRSQPEVQEQEQLAQSRIEYLQRSIDAMALELERVGEAQRFSDKLRVEGDAIPPSKTR